MGKPVAVSRAASGTHWSTLHPTQRLINSCLLAVAAAVVGAYGLSGFIFGCLHFFVVEGFALVQGAPAVGVALGSVALAVAWGSHGVQRHWSTARAASCEKVRSSAYWAWGISWLAALVAGLAIEVGRGRTVALGIAPDGQWFLAPLPWVWRAFVGFAADRVVGRLMVVGFCSLLLGIVLISTQALIRLGMACLGVAVCCLGAYLLGDAAYQYASGRSLLPGLLGVGDLSRDLARHPGSYNAWTFVCWWGGWAFIGAGALAIAAGAFIPGRVLQKASR